MAHLQTIGAKNSLSLAVKFYSSFNFVEIAFIRCVFKQCFHTLTYSQFSTLIIHLHFSSTLSLCTFWKKVPKIWAAVSGIRCFLCSRVALRHLSVGAHLATRSLSQCLGWQELASLKHHATCFQSLLGCSLCLPTLPSRPWRGITFCN